MPATRTRRPAGASSPRDLLSVSLQEGDLPADDSTWLTVDQICTELRIARSTFYDWRAKGRGPKCHKLPNGDIRVLLADYKRWLAGLRDAA